LALILKVAGYGLIALGLLLHAADLYGYLLEQDRLELYGRIERAEEIPRGVPGFEKFIDSFPPSTGSIRADQVTHIQSGNVISSGGVSAAVDIRYLAGKQKTGRVAGLIEAAAWSRETSYGWLSWWLTIAGLVIELCGEVLARRKPSKAS
jgi:hypothetical protein